MPNLNVNCTIKASVRANVSDKQALHTIMNIKSAEREAEVELIEQVKDIGFDTAEVSDMEVYFD